MRRNNPNLWTIYLREGIVYIPTSVYVGMFIDSNPLSVVSADDRECLTSELVSRLKAGNRIVDPSESKSVPIADVPKSAKLRSWKTFCKNTTMWSIEKTPEQTYQIRKDKPEPGGRGWLPDLNALQTFGPVITEEEFVDIVVAVIQKHR